jgi:hypothetical protein
MIKTTTRFAAAFALTLALLALPGCSTNGLGDDAAPVYLTVDFGAVPTVKNVADGASLEFSTVTIKSVMKNPAATTSTMLDVRIDDYVVVWTRIDGGTKAPKSETFGGSTIIPVGSAITLPTSQFMSISALSLSPFDQLFPFNGGIDRETGRSEIRFAATVTFRGHTISGQPVQGTGGFGMTFVYQAL